MIELYLHKRSLVSIFELLGNKENDITASIGWALSQSPSFRAALVRRVFPKLASSTIDSILLQNYGDSTGITDVEIIGTEIHVIIEAKRGWNLPGKYQLGKYAKKLRKSERRHRALVVMAACSDEWARLSGLPGIVDDFKVVYLSWEVVFDICSRVSGCTNVEKRLLTDLRTYLRRIVSMQNQESNWVYVIALGNEMKPWCGMTWRDYVLKNRLFFQLKESTAHWPKEDPPNYLGFRYDGKLSIHHVEKYEIVTALRGHIPRPRQHRWWMGEPHYFCKLGPPIIDPPHEIRATKKLRNTRVWVALDLLLTCKTIPAARNKTDKRLNG